MVLGLALCIVPAASASATITVANQNDSGAGSLRQAILDAGAGESIVVPAGDYALTSGELAIAKALVISGHDAADTTIRSTGAFRVFHTSGASSEITISGLTIRDGNPAPVSGAVEGGGILNTAASLTLRDDAIVSNRVDADALPPSGSGGIAEGGGIAAGEGALTLLDSVIKNNTASAVGGSEHAGGIAEGGGLYSAGVLIAKGNEYVGNSADARGGQGPSNAGQGGGIADGGGLIVFAVHPPIHVSASTILANTVDASGGPGGGGGIGDGGGLWALSNGPPVSLGDLTVTTNLVRALPNGIGDGGGVEIGANSPGVMFLTNATLSTNTVEGEPGSSDGGNGSLGGSNTMVKNTLVSGGVASPGVENCAGVPTSLGHNLDSLDQCNFHAPGDLVNTNPLLGPLQDNGGPTLTLAPLAGSPAIDAGDSAGCPVFDQRGVLRPRGSACDIGAVESAPPSASTGPAANVGETVATLQGSTSNPDVVAGTMFFQWGTSTTYGSQTPVQTLAALSSAQQFPAILADLKPGVVYHFRVVAINAEGTAFGADQAFTTIKPTIPRPAITAARLTNKRFRSSNKDTAISAKKAPAGTSFHFTLSAVAKVQIVFTRSAQGLRSGHNCVAPTAKLRRAHAKRCTHSIALGTLTRSNVPQGADSVSFSGRIGHTPLKPGSYKATLSASNAGGRSNPVTLSFSVVH